MSTLPVLSTAPLPLPLTKKEKRELNKQGHLGLAAVSIFARGDFEDAFQGTLLAGQTIELIAQYAQIRLSSLDISTTFAHLIAEQVDLLDTSALQPLFGASCQTAEHSSSAKLLVKEIQSKKSLYTMHRSRAYTLHSAYPEIYACALHILKNNHTHKPVTLELGAARGFPSLFLGFSEARTVYVNDSDPNELRLFAETQKNFPKNVRDKFVVLKGNCLLSETYTPMKEKTDLVLAFNLIHFFSPDQMNVFFTRIHAVMNPGGSAIFITNSASQVSIDPETETICCDHLTCEITYPKQRFQVLFEYTEQSPKQSFFYVSEEIVVFVRTKLGWGKKEETFKKLTPEMQEKITRVIKARQELIAKAPLNTTISVYKVRGQHFSEKSLARLVNQYGFIVNRSFAIDNSGHIVPENADNIRVGVLCTKGTDKKNKHNNL